VGGHRVLGETYVVAGRWEDVAMEIGVPDASIARDVHGLGWGVIVHEGAGAIRWVEPVAQRGEQVSARTTEDLKEQRLPGDPIGCRGVLSRPKEIAGRLGGNLV